MRWSISLLLCTVCAGTALAGPVDFGMAELNAAIDARNFKYKPKVMAELDIEAPETFRIEPYAAGGGHITGGDLRGLMYALLEAADQMRATGRLKLTHGVPALALRGVRITVKPGNESTAWFTSGDFWRRYFAGAARDRFNRVELSFESQPGPEAYSALRSIAEIAPQYGVDLAIGFGTPNIGAIKSLLRNCPTVRAVVLRGMNLPDAAALLPVLHDAGRRVVLELPDNEPTAGLIEAAGQSGTPLRLFSAFTGTASNPQPRDSYWEMDASQGPDSVSVISGAGFQVAAPTDESGQPALDTIAAWGRYGYSRVLQ